MAPADGGDLVRGASGIGESCQRRLSQPVERAVLRQSCGARRYADGRPHEAVETEALRQTVLMEILRSRLDELIPEPLGRVQEREAQQSAAPHRS
jgi:hypothetical protein